MRKPSVPAGGAAVTVVAPTTLPVVAAPSPADYVKIVSPSAGNDDGSEASGMRDMAPPRGPLAPPEDPNTPHSAFGSTGSSSWSGGGFVVAALVGLLVLVLFNFTSRVALLVEAPLAYRRALSLECPG